MVSLCLPFSYKMTKMCERERVIFLKHYFFLLSVRTVFYSLHKFQLYNSVINYSCQVKHQILRPYLFYNLKVVCTLLLTSSHSPTPEPQITTFLLQASVNLTFKTILDSMCSLCRVCLHPAYFTQQYAFQAHHVPDDRVSFFLRLNNIIWSISTVQPLTCVQLFENPWTAAHQASLSNTNSQSLHKRWTGWISLQSRGLSRVFSNITLHRFFGNQLSLWSNSHNHT